MCWPVITEAAWLLRNDVGGSDRLFELLSSPAFAVVPLDEAALAWVGTFVHRYSSARAQVADAATMYLVHRFDAEAVFTLDRRDFTIFRTTDGRGLRLLPEA